MTLLRHAQYAYMRQTSRICRMTLSPCTMSYSSKSFSKIIKILSNVTALQGFKLTGHWGQIHQYRISHQ